MMLIVYEKPLLTSCPESVGGAKRGKEALRAAGLTGTGRSAFCSSDWLVGAENGGN